MSSVVTSLRRATLGAGLIIALFASNDVFAGPPLICHPYEIGSAKSLPTPQDNLGFIDSYDRKKLVPDVLALLIPDAPVIVRMETLRRAAIYATGNLRKWKHSGGGAYTAEDKELAFALLQKLRERSTAAAATDRALALFDLGFYAETLRQTDIDPALSGYDLLLKARELRNNDPEIEFALALASARPKRDEQSQHLAKAKAAAKENSLLATNLASHFSAAP